MRCGRKEDGYGIVSHEGVYGFTEGKKLKELLNRSDTKNLNDCAKRRGISTVRSIGRVTSVEGVRFT